MKILLNIIICKIALIIFVTVMFVGCASYEQYNPSPVGTFYPNSTIQYVFMEDNSSRNHVMISFSEPVEIESVGIMKNYNSSIKKCEVALIKSPKLNYLPGDDISVCDNFFAPITVLKYYGRIEYTGVKKPINYFLESGWGSFTKVLILINFILLGFMIIKNVIKTKVN